MGMWEVIFVIALIVSGALVGVAWMYGVGE